MEIDAAEERPRYALQSVLGSGTYGVVHGAVDRADGRRVAIKRVRPEIFGHPKDGLCVLREMMFLHGFDNRHIMRLDRVLPLHGPDFESIDMVFERMDGTLGSFILCAALGNNVRQLLFQALDGLAHMHQCGVAHCDVKPANILVNVDGHLRLSDLGSAQLVVNSGKRLERVSYVSTRWYRAPELCGEFMLEDDAYLTASDVWSMGCVFAEMLLGRPFLTGECCLTQLKMILRLLGSPPAALVDRIRNPSTVAYLRALPTMEPIDLQLLLPEGTDPQAIDLLRRMLAFDPADRPSALEALQHPYFAPAHVKRPPVQRPHECFGAIYKYLVSLQDVCDDLDDIGVRSLLHQIASAMFRD
jgi:serine/threonine protein kinase